MACFATLRRLLRPRRRQSAAGALQPQLTVFPNPRIATLSSARPQFLAHALLSAAGGQNNPDATPTANSTRSCRSAQTATSRPRGSSLVPESRRAQNYLQFPGGHVGDDCNVHAEGLEEGSRGIQRL